MYASHGEKGNNMEYRKSASLDMEIGVVGLGTSVLGEVSAEAGAEVVSYAIDHGVNYIDMAGGHAACFPAVGMAIKGRREKVFLQVHFGAEYSSGIYGFDISLEGVKKSLAWQLEQLGTDYIDFGFIHCIDEGTDLDRYISNGVLDYILEMKEKGVVKHIGLSTHTPAIANRVLDMGIIDMLMFSINPMYDYGQGEYAFGESNERYDLYKRCEAEGVGITVMKPFNGGILLDEKQSPFHQALTAAQCIQYALDRPGVLSVMQGAGTIAQLKENLAYLETTEEERDYSVIGSFTPDETKGRCVYCRHCHPCPAGLDIGLVNKYYDLALTGDELAKGHYMTLEKHASDCIQCGHCNSRCPFRVKQQEKMQTISEYFGI